MLALAKMGLALGRVVNNTVLLQWTGFSSRRLLLLLLLRLAGLVIGLGFVKLLELQAQTLPGGHEAAGLCHAANGKR